MIPGTRYRVLRQTAASVRAVAYEVEHLELGRRFKLEVLAAELEQSPELVRQTRAEWQALSKLRHPNIVRVTDAGVTADGLAFCVMEQLRGETLRQRLQRRRSLAVPEALRIGRELATALSIAHAIGVVHRNVQPDQVFLVGDGAARLLGFGPAEAQGAPCLSPCAAVCRYLAPERARGAPADRRSDVYGLGSVLFEMVAGRPAFAASRWRRSGAGAGQGGPPALALAVPGVSRELSELVAGLMAHEPSARPSLGEAIRRLARLELRYQGQVSTTQETAHYVTRKLPLLVDTVVAPSDRDVIVPLPSQTLAGIPWTVTDARAAEPPVAGEAPKPSVLLVAARPSAAAQNVALVRSPTPPGRLPPARVTPLHTGRKLALRLLLVLSCSLLAGVLVASWARRSLAGEAKLPPVGAV